MKKTTDYSREQIKRLLESQAITQAQLEHEFIVKHVPRFHQAIMLMFPFTRSMFNYSIARNEEDHTKLTILRNRKVIAKNFDY